MSTPLQEFSPDKSRYERPTLTWVCGRESEGCPCHIGPTLSGECQADLECTPYRDGDGYRCARPPAWGGACEKGPLPDGSCCQTVVLCQPKRSTRARRMIFSVCSAGFVLGVLLLVFGSDPDIRNELVSPGELTLQHQSSRQKCSDCHTKADLAIDGLTGAQTEMASGSKEYVPLALQDSRRCLSCHDLGDSPLNPHALASVSLTDLTSSAMLDEHADTAPWLVSVSTRLGTSPLQSDELACSICHKEHRGKFFDLTKLADAQCQVCHTKQFHNFATGHPEFDGFPYSRRTRIHFDHTTHYGTHFANFKRLTPDGVAPESCRSCHQPDASRRMMPVVSFEKACGSCHQSQMQGPYTDVAFFAIPNLDLRDQPIGDWPSGISLTNPDDLPPFMKVLLSTQPQWQEGLQILRQAEDDSASQRGHAQLAIATKSLLGDLTENGEKAVRRRLLQAMGDHGSEKIASSLATTTAPMIESLRTASGQWFPNLKDEWQSLSGDSPPAKADSTVNLREGPELHQKGWHIDESESAVRYRPLRHADSVPRELIDALVQIQGIKDEPDGHSSMDAFRSLFAAVTDPRASFRCTKCHSVEQAENGTIASNWKALNPESAERDFVAFSHAPHVTLLDGSTNRSGTRDQDCRTCHKLEQLEERQRTFIHPQYENPLAVWSVNLKADASGCSGFQPTGKAVCAECHTHQRAGDSCLKCHNYHIGGSMHR